MHAGSPMPGLVSRILVSLGEHVVAGQPLFVLEAMKMETSVRAEAPGKVETVLVQTGSQVEAQDLVIKLAPST